MRLVERRLVGSLAIHALFAVGLASIHRGRPGASAPPTLELVDLVVADPPAQVSPPPAIDSVERRAGGAPAPRHARRSAPARTAAVLGELRVEPTSVRGEGDGAGGDGRGTGLGLGNGSELADLVPAAPSVPSPPPPPPTPHVSKARRARLVYPSRQTEVEASALFVAEVIVDAEGFVVGARLARGSGGPRDAEAGAAVWRFRYDPARDDDGAPVRSTVEQTFAVAW